MPSVTLLESGDLPFETSHSSSTLFLQIAQAPAILFLIFSFYRLPPVPDLGQCNLQPSSPLSAQLPVIHAHMVMHFHFRRMQFTVWDLPSLPFGFLSWVLSKHYFHSLGEMLAFRVMIVFIVFHLLSSLLVNHSFSNLRLPQFAQSVLVLCPHWPFSTSSS